jgi:glycosyltransferase involved in cell wall biosynthesis
MRIAVDFKAVSSEAAMRGMGRYTQQQVREILALDPDIEVFLLMHGFIPKENVLFDWNAFPNVHVIPVSIDGHDVDYRQMPSFDTVLAYSHRLQHLLKQLKIDIFHSTVPFMYPYYSAITVCPVVATFYDAIPLLFPSDYFPLREHALHYLRAMDNVIGASRIIAISQSSANDLRLFTGFPASRIHVAYPLIEAVFRQLEPAGCVYGLEQNVVNRLNLSSLPKRFILSVTGIHRSKNVQLLIEGFHTASAQLGEDWALVIVLPSAIAQKEFHRRFGSLPCLITVSDISDQELALLYNRAHMVVQPSMYEGFGYPVAEAMSCGAAVIATNTSSIPEIAGKAALLISPTDANMLAAAIIRVARDRELRSELKARALERSVMFRNPSTVGSVTIEAYQRATHLEKRNTSDKQEIQPAVRPKIAVWSSMPPLDCGVADYSYELVKALACTHDVSVYVDGKYEPRPTGTPYIKFRHPEDYAIEGPPAQTFFQVGARNYQEYMYPYIRQHGGTMVVHDVSMGLGFYYLAKASGLLNEFEDEIVWPEGPSVLEAYARLQATASLPSRDALEAFFLRHKMLRWLVNRSDYLLVHTAPLRERLCADYPEARTAVIRMGVTDTIPAQRHTPRAAWRHALGIGAGGICVGCFGIVDRVKRIDTVIKSFGYLCKSNPTSILILAGRCYDQALRRELDLQIADSPAGDRIIILDYVPQDAFHALVALSDVVVNLRSPDRMGLSAVLMRALAAAKPVIISSIAEWEMFPPSTCLRVAAGDAEVQTLAEHLTDLAGNKLLREQYGHAARRWFLEQGTLPIMADDYMALVDGRSEI